MDIRKIAVAAEFRKSQIDFGTNANSLYMQKAMVLSRELADHV